MPTRCSVFLAVSLDGFIAREDGAIDWLSIVERPGEDYGFGAFFSAIDTLVVGRKTYEVALGFPEWPWGEKRVVVLTSRALSSKHGETFHAGTPAELLARVEAAGAKHVYVDGGVVVRDFLAAGLVDDLTLSVVPIVLGKGTPLWGPLPGDVRLSLRASKTFASGLVQLVYGVARGEPSGGS